MSLKIHHADAADALEESDTKVLERRCRETQRIDLSRPMFICAGGIETNSLKRACGYLNMLCDLLGRGAVPDKNFDVYTLVYAADIHEKTERILGEYKGSTNKSRTAKDEANGYARSLVDAFKDQIPNLTVVTGDAREQQLGLLGERLRNVNLFCFSFGTILATAFHETLLVELMDHGITEAEAKKLLPNVKVLTMGEMGLWQHKPNERWLFSSAHGASTTDVLIEYGAKLENTDGKPKLIPFGKHKTAEAANELLFLADLHLRRHPDEDADKTGHMLKTYVGVGFPGSSHNAIMRVLAQTTLRNFLSCSQGDEFTGIYDLIKRFPRWNHDSTDLDEHGIYKKILSDASQIPNDIQGTWSSFVGGMSLQHTHTEHIKRLV